MLEQNEEGARLVVVIRLDALHHYIEQLAHAELVVVDVVHVSLGQCHGCTRFMSSCKELSNEVLGGHPEDEVILA